MTALKYFNHTRNLKTQGKYPALIELLKQQVGPHYVLVAEELARLIVRLLELSSPTAPPHRPCIDRHVQETLGRQRHYPRQAQQGWLLHVYVTISEILLNETLK